MVPATRRADPRWFLGLTTNALKKRLGQGRYLLGKRLTRRGLGPTVALFTWLISEHGARAAVSRVLIQYTAQAAAAFVAARPIADGASRAAVRLAQGATRTMFLKKCFAALFVLVAAIGGSVALNFVGYQAIAGKLPDGAPVVALQAQAKPNAAEPQKTDAERIVGTWKITNGVAHGKDVPADYVTSTRLVFRKDGKMSFNAAPTDGTYKLVGPGKVDVIDVFGFGIYKFEADDRLAICFHPKVRPTEFSGEEGLNQFLFMLDRAKPGEEKLLPEDLAKFKDPLQKLRDAKQRRAKFTSVREIGDAIHAYHDVYKPFPTHAIYSKNGKTPLLSWRVAILPYMEQEPLYREFKLDESWDSERNMKLIPRMPKLYAYVDANAKNDGMTHYQVFMGPQTAFDGNKKKAANDFSLRLSKIAFLADAKNPVIWTKPADLEVTLEMGKMPAIGGLFPNGYPIVLFGDGAVRTISPDTTPAALREMVIVKE